MEIKTINRIAISGILIAVILFLLLVNSVYAQSQAVYDLSKGHTFLNSFDKKVKGEETFTFFASKNVKYGIIVTSSKDVTVSSEEFNIIIRGNDIKEFAIIGTDKTVSIKFKTPSPTKVTLVLTWEGKI